MKYATCFEPQRIAPDVFLAAGVQIVGRVDIAAQSSVWFNAVIRGDVEEIRLGRQTNVQDLAVLHADPGRPCLIGDRVTIGHSALVHGAVVEDQVLIGMRSVIMNGARIGTGSLIGAGALIPEGTVIPPGSVVLGMPGKVIRQAGEREAAAIDHAADHYVEAAREFLANDASESSGEANS